MKKHEVALSVLLVIIMLICLSPLLCGVLMFLVALLTCV